MVLGGPEAAKYREALEEPEKEKEEKEDEASCNMYLFDLLCR